MNNATTDRDLLILEPLLYVDPFLSVQTLCGGSDGHLAATAFSSTACDFQAAGVQAGMVLCAWAGGREPIAYEVLAIASAHALTVSMLREQPDGPALPPAAVSGALSFRVHTYRPQLLSVAQRILEGLHRADQADVDLASAGDSPRFRQAVALGAAADIFSARVVSGAADDVNAQKAQLYRGLFDSAVESFQLASASGPAAGTGNVQLRRA